MGDRLVFLKLGGSLITDKNQPHTPRLDLMQRLAGEIAEAVDHDRELRIVLGHGSGSFGHVPASKYQTRLGVRTAVQWNGFVEVWREAAKLNHHVLRSLAGAGLPALAFPPLAMVTADHGKVVSWNLDPIINALHHRLLPVIQGDVVFDTTLGGTILSTEDLFAYLVEQLHPAQVLLAGSEPGVWADYPQNSKLLPEITPASFKRIAGGLGGSAATDVTGGMADKVHQVVAMIAKSPGMSAVIFRGEEPGNVRRALLGEILGTLVHEPAVSPGAVEGL